jgi:hypothetical protein
MANNAGHSEGLKMRIARRHADEYDDLIKQSNEACDCQDCETTLKLGIEVFDWIIDTDQEYRGDVYAEKRPYSQEMEEALEHLMRRWYGGCGVMIRWAEHHIQLGFEVSHLKEFKQRCEEAAGIVESLDEGKEDRIMSDPLIILRDKALEEHRNGQTAGFF